MFFVMSASQEKIKQTPQMGSALDYGEALIQLQWMSRQEASPNASESEIESLGRLYDLNQALLTASPDIELGERLTCLTEEDTQLLERYGSFSLNGNKAFSQLCQVGAKHLPSNFLFFTRGERVLFESIAIYDLCPEGDPDKEGMRLVAVRGIQPRNSLLAHDFNVSIGWITDEEYKENLKIVVDLAPYLE